MVALLDIKNIREGSCVLKFSDDSTLSASEQRDLDSLERWSSAWGMKFNSKKMSNYVHRQWEVTSYLSV